MSVRIEVRGTHPAAGEGIIRNAAALGIGGVAACRISRLYFLAQNPGADAIERLCAYLLVDPITESATWSDAGEPAPVRAGVHVVEVAFRPGVTDIAARANWRAAWARSACRIARSPPAPGTN